MVAFLLEAITNAWVENSYILLGRVIIPEWILSSESSGTSGHPWAAFEDNYLGRNAEDLLDAWSELEARQAPLLVGIDTGWLEVEIVNTLNALD